MEIAAQVLARTALSPSALTVSAGLPRIQLLFWHHGSSRKRVVQQVVTTAAWLILSDRQDRRPGLIVAEQALRKYGLSI